LQEFFAKEEKNFDSILRKLLTKLTQEKGHFDLHADELSHLTYDIQFYLYSRHERISSATDYLEHYPEMIALADHAISTFGYASDFVEDWLEKRMAAREIITDANGQLKFSDAYQQQFLATLQEYE
jgi:hypothetical protein